MQKETTLFQHVKQFINERYNGPKWFSTQQMRNAIGHYENRTSWKQYNNNPNYVMHIYIGYLHDLGCITRTKRGHYKINAPIPQWFGSYHFNGLKGKLNDPSNFYWNSLPADHKVNPWAKQVVEDTIRVKFPANVEGCAEFYSAVTDSISLDDRIEELERQIATSKRIMEGNKVVLERLLAERDGKIHVHHNHHYETHVYDIETMTDSYNAIVTYDPDTMEYSYRIQTLDGHLLNSTTSPIFAKLQNAVTEAHKKHTIKATW